MFKLIKLELELMYNSIIINSRSIQMRAYIFYIQLSLNPILSPEYASRVELKLGIESGQLDSAQLPPYEPCLLVYAFMH